MEDWTKLKCVMKFCELYILRSKLEYKCFGINFASFFKAIINGSHLFIYFYPVFFYVGVFKCTLVHILVQVFLFVLWFSENDENSQIFLFISKLKPSQFFIYSHEFFVAICTFSFICYGPLIALWVKIFLSTYP